MSTHKMPSNKNHCRLSCLLCEPSTFKRYDNSYIGQSHEHERSHDKSGINPSAAKLLRLAQNSRFQLSQLECVCFVEQERCVPTLPVFVFSWLFISFIAHYAFIIVITALNFIRHIFFFFALPPHSRRLQLLWFHVCLRSKQCMCRHVEHIFEFYCSGIVAFLACSNVTFIYPEQLAGEENYHCANSGGCWVCGVCISGGSVVPDARVKYVLTSIPPFI